jgi:hypothetical protein
MLRILRFLEFFYYLKFKTERNVSGNQSVPILKWKDWVGMYPVLSNRKSYSQMLDSLYKLTNSTYVIRIKQCTLNTLESIKTTGIFLKKKKLC